MSSGRIATMLDAAEKVLHESGLNDGIPADEIVRRMLAGGFDVSNLTPNSLYSAVGADIRTRQQKGAPQRFDRPGVGATPSTWVIALASYASSDAHSGSARRQPAFPQSSAGSGSGDEAGRNGVASAPPSPPPARRQAGYERPATAPIRDRTTAALLCVFLGGVGAHRFYVGKPRSAVVQAALVAGGVLLGASRGGDIGDMASFAALGGSIWVIADFINILRGRFTDATGNRLGKAAPAGAEPAVQEVADSRRTEQSILRAAKSLGGLVGPTELALQTGLTIDEAKEHLEGLVKRGHAQLQIRKNGSLAYTFPDLLSDEKRAELEEF